MKNIGTFVQSLEQNGTKFWSRIINFILSKNNNEYNVQHVRRIQTHSTESIVIIIEKKSERKEAFLSLKCTEICWRSPAELSLEGLVFQVVSTNV